MQRKEEIKSLNEAAAHVLKQLGKPDIAIVLGSGLGNYCKDKKILKTLNYGDIPGMPRPSVSGHDGKIVAIEIANKRVFCFAGRIHFYEGHSYHSVCFQVRLMRALGCKLFIITAAVGGLHKDMEKELEHGSFMLIKDHARYIVCENPVYALREESIMKQPEGEIWSPEFNKIAREIAKELNIELFEGSYIWASGPSFDTPKEVLLAKRMFVNDEKKDEAASVGMSTVPEALVGASCGMAIGGIAAVVNMGAGLADTPLSHDQTKEYAKKAEKRFSTLITEIITKLDIDKFPNVEGVEVVPNEEVMFEQQPFPKNLEESINAAQQFVSEKISSAKVAYVTIGSFNEVLNEHATENAVISLKDIPNFPMETMAGYTGKIGNYTTKDTNTSIYVLSTNNLNGFSIKESAFLSFLFIKLGVQFVNFLITGEHNDPEGLKTHVVSLQDAFDYSTSCQSLDFIQRRVEKEGSLYPKMPGIVKKYQNDLSVPSAHSYFTISGESLPTPTEAKFARFGGCDIAGVTDLTLMNYLHIFGIPVFPIVVLPKQQRKDLNSSLLQNCVNESKDDIVKLLNDIMKKVSSENEIEKKIEIKIKDDNFESKFIDSDLSKKVSYFIKMEFQQIFKEPIPKKAIIDITNALSIPKQEIVAEIDFSKIPYLGDVSGKVGIWMCDKNPVLFVSANSHIHIWNNDTIILLRAFKDMGITEVICTSFVQSISKDLKVGDLCLIKDHVNFTGRNPLIGKNDEFFGDRFPDMSQPYNKLMNERIKEIAKIESKEIKEVDCLATQMCIFHSEKEIEMGTNYQTEICSTSFVREVIIANHMRMRVSVCAIVSQDESDDVLREEPTKDLTKIISSYFAKYSATNTETN